MNMSTESQAKLAAKNLRVRLALLGVSITHTQSLESIAATAGFTDWNRYQAWMTKAVKPTESKNVALFSKPGSGAWGFVRYSDWALLEANPSAHTIWLIPYHLSSGWMADEASSIHQVASRTRVASVECWNSMLQAASPTQRTIIVTAPEGGEETPEAILEWMKNAMSGWSRWKGSTATARINCLDIQRWTRAKGVSDWFASLSGMTHIHGRLLFQTQMSDDVELLDQHLSIQAYAIGVREQAELAGLKPVSLTRGLVTLVGLANSYFSDADLGSTEGLIRYLSRSVALNKIEIEAGSARGERITNYLNLELKHHQQRRCLQ
jgi:hypothetical protein